MARAASGLDRFDFRQQLVSQRLTGLHATFPRIAFLPPRLAHPSITEGQRDPTSGRSTAAGGLAQIGRFRRNLAVRTRLGEGPESTNSADPRAEDGRRIQVGGTFLGSARSLWGSSCRSPRRRRYLERIDLRLGAGEAKMEAGDRARSPDAQGIPGLGPAQPTVPNHADRRSIRTGRAPCGRVLSRIGF